MNSDEAWMRLALEEAAKAPAHADIPVGAILIDALGLEIGRGHNERESQADPTAHAEVQALRAAAKAQGAWHLGGSTLYVTLEPCAMCAGAIVNARVSRVVYAARDPKAGAMESLFTLGRDPRLNHRVQVTSGVRGAEASAQLTGFFAALRKGT